MVSSSSSRLQFGLPAIETHCDRPFGSSAVLGPSWRRRASRRKRGPVAFRPRLSAGLALSAKSEHTPTVLNTRINRRMESSERPLSRTKRKSDSAPLNPSLTGKNGHFPTVNPVVSTSAELVYLGTGLESENLRQTGRSELQIHHLYRHLYGRFPRLLYCSRSAAPRSSRVSGTISRSINS